MFTGIIIRDSGTGSKSEVKINYERVAAARRGVSKPTPLDHLGLLVPMRGASGPAATEPDSAGVLDINSPPAGAPGVNSRMLVLRIEPAPERISSELTAEGQREPVIYAPIASSFSRVPGTRRITFETVVDAVFTPKAMGVSPEDWRHLVAGKNWISDYITFLESLATPLPTLGRKPWLALKHGKDVYGAGRFGLQLEAVSTSDERQGPNGIQSAKLQVQLVEYLVV